MNLRTLRAHALVCMVLLVAAAAARAQDTDARVAEAEARLNAAADDIAILTERLARMQDRMRKLQALILDLTLENVRLKRMVEKKTADATAPKSTKPAPSPWSLTGGKPRRASVATPAGLHVLVVAQAKRLKLTGTVPEGRRKTAQADLDRWIAARGIIGRKVVWTVAVRSADEAFAAREADLLTEQLLADRVNLLSAQADLDRIHAGRADASLTRALGRDGTVTQLQTRIAELNRRIPDLTLRIRDIRAYPIKVTAVDPGDPHVTIVGDFHTDSRARLAQLRKNDTVRVEGAVRRVRCAFTEEGKAVFPIELARCRVPDD